MVLDTISYSDCYRNEITRTDLLLNPSKSTTGVSSSGIFAMAIGKRLYREVFHNPSSYDTISYSDSNRN